MRDFLTTLPIKAAMKTCTWGFTYDHLESELENHKAWMKYKIDEED